MVAVTTTSYLGPRTNRKSVGHNKLDEVSHLLFAGHCVGPSRTSIFYIIGLGLGIIGPYLV